MQYLKIKPAPNNKVRFIVVKDSKEVAEVVYCGTTDMPLLKGDIKIIFELLRDRHGYES